MSPLIHDIENIADIYTNATGQILVKPDVTGKAVPVAIKCQADQFTFTIEYRTS